MDDIKKITKYAATSILAGITLTGTASAADLGDYPKPFVGEEGNVDANIVVGENAKTIDVVGGIELAGTLSQAAFTEETVSTGSGSFGWSASNGVTLDTRNDQIYFNDSLDTVRSSLTSQHISSLKDTTFRDGSGTETDIQHFINPASQKIKFGKPSDRNDQDPVLYVKNPSNTDSSQYLFKLQATFDNQINFTSSDVEEQQIELFGKEYTVSTDSTSSKLVLFGSQETLDISSGETRTVNLEGEEHTFELSGVTSSDEAVLQVDGEQEIKAEDETFSVSGQEVRIKDVLNYAPEDSSTDSVTLGIGSDELGLKNGETVEDGEGDDIEGTYVELNGDSSDAVDELSSITVYVGSKDSNREYVKTGESFSHSLFENVVFHFGGLNPDAEEGESAGEISFSAKGDDTLSTDYTSSKGDSTKIEYAHTEDPSNFGSNDVELADDDNDNIEIVEGANVTENEYLLTDAGDFSHIWEVTNIDRDASGGNIASGDQATADLKDVATGNTVEVTLDVNSDTTHYEGTEIIDGQTYYFELDGSAASDTSADLFVTWGSSASTNDNSNLDPSTGSKTTVYPAQDTESDAALALTKQVDVSSSVTVTDIATGDFTDVQSNSPLVSDDTSTTSDTDTIKLGDSNGEFQGVEVKVTENGEGGSKVLSFSGGTGSQSTTNGNVTLSSNGDGSEATIDIDTSGTTTTNNIKIGYINVTAATTSGTFTPDKSGATLSTDNLGDFVIGSATKTEDLSSLELPSTESTSSKSPGSSVSLSFDSLTDESTFTVGQLTYAINDTEQLRLNATSTANNNTNYIGAAVIEPEDDSDNEQAYIVEHGSDTSNSQVTVSSPVYTGSTRQTTPLESNDDVTAGYDRFGAYTEYDTDNQNSFSVNLPNGQATAGSAFTSRKGGLSSEAESGSAITQNPAGWPETAVLDSEIDTPTTNTILVGGPAVNELVKTLADQGKTQSASEYSRGEAIVQLVEDAWSRNDALIVAGYSGSDTRAAASFLADYQDHQSELTGDKVTINTAQGTVVQ